MSFSRNYRQYSYSENNIKDIVFSKKKENGDFDYSIVPSDSSIRLSLNNVDNQSISNQSISNQSINNLDNQSVSNQDISVVSEENETQKKEYNISHYLFKRFLMFIIHLCFIALFEIIFFFSIITTYESNILLGLVDSFVNPVSQQCVNYNYQTKTIITNLLNSFMNITNIDTLAQESLDSRNVHNNKILLFAWLYFVALLLLVLIMILCNLLKKKKVNLVKVFIDNLIMISLLGCYEYLFFKTIIINFYVINNIELLKYVIVKLNNCLV
jgi:hypothetical protein